MAKVTVHAGDFRTGDGHYFDFLKSLNLPSDENPATGEIITLSDIEEIDTASEESVKRFGGTVGWGAAGALILGPAGLLAGLLLGGRKKEVTFVARLKDGRRFMATTDSKTYVRLKAAAF